MALDISSISAPQINRAMESSDATANRLNPGLRINTTKDDAAGLEISDNNLRANANDSVTININQSRLDGANSVGKDAINTLESILGGIVDANQIGKTRQTLQADYNENVKDIDYAAESAAFQKYDLLSQSGSYAMSQANVDPEMARQLLA